MLQLFGILSGILASTAVIPYIWDTLKGSTRPNRATWLIWTLLLIVALFSQIDSGGKSSVLLTVGDLIGSGLTLALAFYKGTNYWHWIDKLALVGAALGFISLFVFHEPLLALLILIFIDICGLVPTLRKVFVEPDSETMVTWLMIGVGGIFASFAVGEWNLILLIYPVYLMVANLAVALTMTYAKHRKKSRV